MRCAVRLLAFHIITNLVEYSFGRTKAQVRKNEDRPYIFRKTQHRTPRGKGGKEKKAKRKSAPALNTVDKPSTPFLELRGLEGVEEMSNEIGQHKSTSRGDGLISLRLLQPSLSLHLPTFFDTPLMNYRKSSARARFFPRASSGATATAPASGASCASAPSVFASGADTIMSLAK